MRITLFAILLIACQAFAETIEVGDWKLSGGGKEALSLSFRGRRVMSDVATGYWTEHYRGTRFGGRVVFVRRDGNVATFAKTNEHLRLKLDVELSASRAKFTLTAEFLKAPGPFEYGFNLPFDDLAVAEGVPCLRTDGRIVELYRDTSFGPIRTKELAFELPESRMVFRNLSSRSGFTLQDMRKEGRGGARFIAGTAVDAPERRVFEHEWVAAEVFDGETACLRAKRLSTPFISKEPVPFANDGFEDGRKEWSFPSNGSVDASQATDGRNSACLAIMDPAKDQGVYITRQVPIVGGAEYRLVAKVRTENVREAKIGGKSSVGAALILEWDDRNRKWMQGGAYSKGLWGTNEWRMVTTEWATAPVDAGYAAVFLALRATGRAWFDEVRLERRLAKVDKLEPADGVTLANNCPHFIWRHRLGVRRYTVEISRSDSFPKDLTFAYDAGGVAEYQLERPLRPGRWFWRVNGAGALDAGPAMFVQTAPANRDTLPPLLKTEAARVTAPTESFTVRVKDDPSVPRAKVTFDGVTAKFAGERDGLLDFRFDPPAGGWRPGLTAGDMVLVDAAGNRGARRFWLNNAPKPANDSVIAADGRFAVGGRRFFPLGIYEVAPKYMLEVRRAGYDVVHTYRWESSQDDAACAKYLDACWAAEGLRAFVGFDRSSLVNGEYEHVASRVAAIGAHPAMFCWYLFDEPEIKNQFVSPDQLTAYADFIRKLDPYHAVVMSTWNRTMDEYRGSWDTHWTQAYGDPAGVVRQLDEHRRFLKDCPSPITLLVNCNDGELGKLWKKGITPDPEKFSKDYDYLRACAFLGIVKECNGVWWWWFARDTRSYFTAAQAPKSWANLVRVVKELGALRQVVDADGSVRAGTVTVGKAKIEWWAKTVEGRTTLIVVNTATEAVAAEIAVPGFAPRRLDLRRYEVRVIRDLQ